MTHGVGAGRDSRSREAQRLVEGVGTVRGPLLPSRSRRKGARLPGTLSRWAGFTVIDAAHDVERRYAKAMRDIGTSLRDFVVLSEIDRRPGIGQSALAWRLGLGRSRLSEQLAVLDGAGYIERQINELDLRKRRIWVSGQGLVLLEEARAVASRVDNAWLAGLSQVERDHLRAFLRRLSPGATSRGTAGRPASPTSSGRP
jgi:DNA-binding MarR family transcriptional regulator